MGIYHFLILGSEARQNYLAAFLSRAGQEVVQAQNYQPGYHEVILLPVPQSAKYLEENIDSFQRGQTIYGCNFPVKLQEQGEKRGLHFVDYMMAEGVAERNAVATAEGAVAEALQHGCRCIQGSRVLLTGYGRCGRVLAEKLLGFGADVTVAERKEERRKAAQQLGCEVTGFSDLRDYAKKADFIFNTVPALVLDAPVLKYVSADAAIIDIASAPGGVDFDFCREKGISANLCLGLPGKYAPKSSAEILLEVIRADFPFALR